MKHLFQALSRTSDGAFIINEQHQIIFWNQAAQMILGYTAEEATSRQCYKVLGGRDEQGRTLCQRYCRVAISALQGDTLPNMDVYALNKDSAGRWINVTTFAFPTGERGLGHVIVHLFRDTTQKKSNEHFVEEIVAATRERRNENERPGFSTTPAEFPPDPGFDALTPRERQVLLLLAHGLGTDEMANMLSISPATTRNHIQSILGKLRVNSRLEAVAYAYQHGLIV
jgi:PAS domain S-box-containing protein